MLAFAGAFARQQRRGDRLRGGDRGQFVGQDRAQQPRARFVGAGLYRRQPRKSLDHRIVGGLCRVGALFAKAADRDIDDLWRGSANGVLADPQALGDAGAKVLDKDIGAGDQPHQSL